MTYFVRFANTFRMTPNSAVDITNSLPAGTYAIKIDDSGMYLEVISDFTLPPKLYGDCEKQTTRIINTFHERKDSTGVFLEGEKGSGKTLLGKNISVKLAQEGVPTIVVNSPLFGEAFNTFIQAIDQEAVIFFDEFEKVYCDTEDLSVQERVLTLFDGVYPSKKLFIVTCNDAYRVDKNMKNRPGRMYYMLSFKGLEENFIREYAEENLIDKSQVNNVVSTSILFHSFNFDMLKALVEEMNRYGESAQEALKMLNAKPSGDKGVFDINLVIGGKAVTLSHGYEQWQGNPLINPVHVNIINPKNTREVISHQFKPSDLVKIDGESGEFVFTNELGETVTLSRKRIEVIDYTKFI